MEKKDLKVGYLVEVRDGDKGVIMPVNNRDELNICRYDDMGISNLIDYNEDLTCNKGGSNYDIIRVWGYAPSLKALTLETNTRKLLWERDPKKSITLELTDEQIESLKQQGII